MPKEGVPPAMDNQQSQVQSILVLYAHPSPSRSEVNVPLFRDAKEQSNVTVIDLYAEYPDFNIDIDKEQQRLLTHDVIIFLFPLYWYSTPSLLKEWQDLVLEYGFAYGDNGNALNGKRFFCALSAGGREEAYQTDGFNHFTLKQLLQPLEQMASLTGMVYLSPFAIFNSRTAKEEQRIQLHRQKWRRLLQKLADNTLDVTEAKSCENLAYCPAITGEIV